MSKPFTLTKNFYRSVCVLMSVFLIGVFIIPNAAAQQQQNFATLLIDDDHASNPERAHDLDLTTGTELESYGGVAVGAFSYEGQVTIGYSAGISGNTTTYVKLAIDNSLFQTLLGGNLGSALGGLLGNIVLGDHYIKVEALDGNTPVASASSNTLNAFNSAQFKLMVGTDGGQYLAITPGAGVANYNRIRITDITDALLIGDTNHTTVFGAYYLSGTALCTNFAGAALDQSGANITLTGQPVSNIHRAIDGNPATASTFTSRLLNIGVGSTLIQNFYLSAPSAATDAVKITMSTSASVLDLDVLSGIQITTYNGTQAVSSQSLDELNPQLLGLVGLDLLGLLGAGETVSFSIAPGASIDRVSISLNSVLSAGLKLLSANFNIHEIALTAGIPTVGGLDANNTLLVCSGVNPTLTATPSGTTDVVRWYDAPVGGQLLHTGTSFPPGPVFRQTKYYVGATTAGCSEESLRLEVIVDLNPNPQLTLNGASFYRAAEGETITLPTVAASNTNGSPVTVIGWAALNGAPLSGNVAGPFTQPGTYIYRYSVQGTGCTNYVDLIVNIYDPDGCNFVQNRKIANNATEYTVSSLLGLPLGVATNPNLAGDANLTTYSHLSETVNLLAGALTGETSQTLSWNQNIPAGTPVTVKLGREFGVAAVAGGIQVQAMMNSTPVGPRLTADADLVSLVSGLNDFEFTFMPADGTGPKEYNGVKVILNSGLLSGVQNVRVYGAYYHQLSSTLDDCANAGVIDIMTGFESIISGLNVASGLTAVLNPNFAVDSDMNSFASLNNAVGVNIRSKLDITYGAPALEGDSISMKLGVPTGLLDLTLLSNLSIQRYLGNQAVGTPVALNSSLLTLNLLSDQSTGIVSFINDVPFDRVKFLTGGVVDALNAFRVYDFKIVPKVVVPGLEYDDAAQLYFLEICAGGSIDIPTDGCDQFKFYSESTGGVEITEAEIKAWATGTVHTVYVQPVRFGCEIGDHRQEIEIRVIEVATPVISPTGTQFVKAGDQVVLNVTNTSAYGNGVTFEWYRDATLIAGVTGPTLTISNLDIAADLGAYTAVAVLSCKSAHSAPTTLALFDAVSWKSYVTSTGNQHVSGGEEVTYTIHVKNNGTMPLSGLVITDRIPQNTSYIDNSASNGGTIDGGLLTWNGINIAAGGTTTVSFKVSVNANLVGVTGISNVAKLKRNAEDPGSDSYPPVNNSTPTAPDTTKPPGTIIPVVLISNIGVDKVADQARVKAGTETTFTITLKNNGPSFLATGSDIILLERPGTGVSILGFTIQSGPAVITVNSLRAVVKTNAILPVNGEIVVKVRALVSATATGTITNGISVWKPGTPETDPPVIDDTDPIPVDRETDLAIVKTIDNSSPFVGDNITFTLTVTNNGPSSATNVVVTDQLPTGFEYVSHTASVGTFVASSGLWTIGNVANAGTAVLEIVAKVLPTGNYINTGSVTGTETDPDLTNNTDSPDDTVIPINQSDSRLEIVKNNALANGVDENRLEVTLLDARGDGISNVPVTFTITRPGNVVSTQIINTYTDGKALLAITSTVVGPVSVAASSPGVTIAGSPRTVTFVAGAVDHARSTLEVTKDNALANGIDKNILVATIVDAAGHPLTGQSVLFTITNIDNTTSTVSVVTTANGQAPLELTSYAVGQVTVAAMVGGTAISGSPKTVTFVAGAPDPNLSTLVVTKNNAVADGVDKNILVATIVDSYSHLLPNIDVVFTIVDVNNSSSTQTIKTDATGKATLELTSTKVGNVTVSASVSGAAISGSPKTVTFVAGAVDHSQSTLVVTKDNAAADGVDENRLLATIVDSQGNPIRNTAVDFRITDVDLAVSTQTVQTDNAGQAVLRVRSTKPGQVVVAAEVAGTAISGSPKTVTFVNASNLVVYKSADQSRVVAGRNTTFTITVRNNGPVAIQPNSDLRLTERPGAGVEILGYEMISGGATLTVNGLDATLRTTSVLGVGSEIKVRVLAKIAETATGTITNGISVWGPDTPPTSPPDDEDDTPPIPVDKVADLAVVKTVDNYTPFVGSNVVFTIEVTNNGPSDAEGARVVDQLPSGYRYVSSTTTTGQFSSSTNIWTIGDLDVGQIETMTITAKVLASGDYINYATISGDDEDPNLNNNTDTPDEPVVPQPIKGLKGTKVANVTKVEPGQAIEFTITLTNQGPNIIAANSDIDLQELPSAGLTITGISVSSGPATITVNGNTALLKTTQALAVDAAIVVKVTARVADDASGSISNRVKVWGPEKDPDDTPDVDTETPDIPVDDSAKIGLTKVSDTPTVYAGGKANFTVTLTNNGPGALKTGDKVIVVEEPSAGLANLTYQISSGNATVLNTNNTLTLTITQGVAKGGTIVLKVSADVTATAGSTISNRVKVWGPDTPPTDDPDDEKETPDIPVINNYSLSVTKVADQIKVVPGAVTTFTVTVRNEGPQAIPSGRMITILEVPGVGITIQGYQVVSGAASIQGTGNNAVLTTTGEIASGGQIGVKISAMVDNSAQGTITNGIKVWNDTRDPDEDDPDDEDNTPPVPVDNELVIPNLFTPNGDGINDKFVIRGLTQYSQRELTVVNRWGSQVYSSKNYNGEWDGGSLPEGTYFYILKIKGQGDWVVKQGAIAIVRNTNR